MKKNAKLSSVISAFDPPTLTYLIRDESPRTAAFILLHAHKDAAARVLSSLKKEQQSLVIRGIASLKTIPDISCQKLVQIVQDKLNKLPGSLGKSRAGLITINGMDVLRRMGPYFDRNLVDRLKNEVPEIYRLIRDTIPDFEDIAAMDDKHVQTLLRSTRKPELVLAMKLVSEQVKRKICANLSERAAMELLRAVEEYGPARRSDVEAAQRNIMMTARKLQESGKIVVRTMDEMVE